MKKYCADFASWFEATGENLRGSKKAEGGLKNEAFLLFHFSFCLLTLAG